jgi:hypothetical protein
MPASLQPDIEEQLSLALNAFETKQIKSLRQAAITYNVPRSTLLDRYHGRQSRRVYRPMTSKLTTTEEAVLIQRVVDLDKQGFPPRLSIVRGIANILLASRGISPPPTVGINWPTTFVKRSPQLRTTYTRKYDY